MLVPVNRPEIKSKQDMVLTQRNMDTASTAFSMPTDTSIVEGWIDPNDDISVRGLARDMYYHDPICGGAANIYSSLPFGDFSLSGLPDREMLYKFMQSLEAIKLKSLFQPIAVDYFVDGAACGALNWNDNKKIFDYYIPLNADDITFHHQVMYGATPLMDVKFPEEYRKIFSKKNDKRVEDLKASLPNIIKDAVIKGGILELNPENSVYIPRAAQSFRNRGISLFNTIMPYWLLEKALLRGTIIMAHRRQRGILVVTMGSENWSPTQADMRAHVNEIILADRDPLGTVIAVRPDISFQEIRDASAFWKHSDVIDTYNQLKMKALGISDSAYSGDSSVGAAESVMNIFNQNLRSTRENIVRKFLYENVFPTISKNNGFKKEDKFSETASVDSDGFTVLNNRVFSEKADKTYSLKYMDTANEEDIQYYNPTVNFHTSLRPEASSDYMSTLETLTKMGVPIPLRTICAAAGISVGDLVAGEEEDLALRKTLKGYYDKLQKFLPKPDESQGDFAAFDTLGPTSNQQASILHRKDQFEEFNDRHAFRLNGKKLLSRKGRRFLDEAHNRTLSAAASRLAKRSNKEIKR